MIVVITIIIIMMIITQTDPATAPIITPLLLSAALSTRSQYSPYIYSMYIVVILHHYIRNLYNENNTYTLSLYSYVLIKLN